MSPNYRRVARAGRWVAFAAAVTAIAGAAVAGAAVQRKATTTVAPQTSGSATAKCRDGQVALAAGFGAKGFDPSTGPARALCLDAAWPQRRDDGVQLQQYRHGRACLLRLLRHACPSSAGRVEARPGRAQQHRLGGGQVRAGRRGDRRGLRDEPSADHTHLDAGGPARLEGQGLQHRRHDGPAGAAGRLRDLQEARSTARHEVDGRHREHRAQDLPGQVPRRHGKVLSGGFDGHLSGAGEQLVAAGALTSKRTDQGHAWTTTALSASSPNPATITTYAYCRQ